MDLKMILHLMNRAINISFQKNKRKRKKKFKMCQLESKINPCLSHQKKNAQGFKNPENTINSANHLKSKTLALGIQNQN